MLVSNLVPSRVVTSDEDGVLHHVPVESHALVTSDDSIEPKDVSQVFVIQSLSTGYYSLKNSLGKYLSSDQLGRATASKPAVGPSEEWTVTQSSEGFNLQSSFGKYLSVDIKSGKMRADSESVDTAECFSVLYQSVISSKVADQSASFTIDWELLELEEK